MCDACSNAVEVSLPFIVTSSLPGPKSIVWAKHLAKVESPDTTFLSDTFPVFWERGQGCIVYDADGNRFLDLTSSFGVLGVGHSHPDVVAALQSQVGIMVHGMGDVHPSVIKVKLLQKIAEHSPVPDPKVILGINGSDSVEAALKTAYMFTGRAGVLAFDGGYHGLSYGALEPTARSFFRDAFSSQRGKFASHLPYGCSIELIQRTIADNSPRIGAVIVEPIQGRGGIILPPAGWLARLRDVCSKQRVLLIFDEIFTGWGRTGSWFACQYESVTPDLICMGKTMGGGMPLSACVGSSALIDAAWVKSSGEAHHTYTFLGHPLSCASALAAIKVIEDEDLVERARLLGEQFLDGLRQLVLSYPAVLKEARGRGLMLGMEFVDRATVWPFVLAALRRGIIVLPAGDNGEVIEITPPFIISEMQIKWSLQQFDEIIAEGL